MSRWSVLEKLAPELRVVLVLQGDLAFWFREDDQSGLESFTETIEGGELELSSGCPWIRQAADNSMLNIQLVLDSHLDELDRVRAPELSAGWLGRLQCRRMMRQLRTDFPSARIQRLAAHAAPDVLSIVHTLLPEHWQSWLVSLQKENVCVSHVVSSLEVLCRYASSQARLRRKPVLFHLPAGHCSRHLLVDGGVPVFMRLLPVGNEGSAFAGDESISQSLGHVRKHLSGAAGMPLVVRPGTNEEGQVPTSLLLAMLCLGKAVDVVSVSQRLIPVDEDSAEFTDALETSLLCIARDGTVPERRLARWHRHRADRQWRLTPTHRLAGGLLQPSVMKNTLQRRIRQLHKASRICAWVATIAVVLASIHGVLGARQRARLDTEKKRLEEKIEPLSSMAASMNRDPAFVLRSMDRIVTHEQAAPMGTGEVLESVATALNDFPALQLDELSWSVFYDEPFDVMYTTLEQSPKRQELWQEGTRSVPLQVELGGKIISEHGLREQQQSLEAFIHFLESMSGVSAVKVLESPVNSARSSDRLSRQESVYRVSLLLGAS